MTATAAGGVTAENAPIGLSRTASHLTFWLALYGTFANWATTLLAAVWAAGASMPIVAAGNQGSPARESVITVLLFSLSSPWLSFSRSSSGGYEPAAPRANGDRPDAAYGFAPPFRLNRLLDPAFGRTRVRISNEDKEERGVP